MKKTILTISSLPIWSIGEGKGMRVIYETHQSFVQKKWNVHYLFSHARSNKNKYTKTQGMHIHNFFVPYPTIKIKYICTLSSKIYLLVFGIVVFFKGLFLARRIHPDIIYAQTYYAGLPSFLLAKLLKIPVVYRDFGCWDLLEKISHPLKKLSVLDRIAVLKLPYTHYILTDDGTQYDVVAEKLHIPKQKISFLRNGVQKDLYVADLHPNLLHKQFSLKPDTIIFLSVTRLVSYKGVHEIIAACKKVYAVYKQFHLFIVGSGPEENALKQQVNEAQLQKHVTFVGAITHEKLRPFYTLSDVFISMYKASNLGNPLFEAMSTKNVIIAKNTGKTADLVQHTKNGILVSPTHTIQELSQALIQVIQDKHMRNVLKNQAYEDFQKHFDSWQQRTEKEIGILLNLMHD